MPMFTPKAAAARLPKLIARAEAGEEIARGTKPVAMIVSVQSKPKAKRQFGRLKGLVKVGPEFFEPLPEEELKLWEGDS